MTAALHYARSGAIVLGLALPAAWRVLTTPFIDSHDGMLHATRLVAFDSLVRQGVLFPRLYPEFAAGYGYPLGTFYPPLSAYIAELPLLVGGDALAGVRVALALSLVVAAAGGFLLGQSLTGRLAGGALVAAAYLYAPYVLATVYIRGALAEAWAIALLPWCFWALDRWQGSLRAGQRAALAVAALALAGLLLAHNLIAFLAWPLALLWWAIRFVARAQASGMRRSAAAAALGWGLLPFVLAAGLAAFSWLPALSESSTIALDRFAGRTLRRLLPLERLVDLEPAFSYALFRFGLVQAAGVAAGTAAALALRQLRLPALYGAAGVGVSALLLSTLAAPLWSGVRLLDPLLFPFRLLGPAALLGAIAAAPLALLRWGQAIAAVGAVAFAAAALARLPVVERPLDRSLLTPAGVVRWEYVDRSVGTTFAQEYLPAGVAAVWRWPADGFLPPAAVSDLPLAAARLLRFGPYGLDLAVRAEQPTALRLHAFALPGWSATLNGTPAPVGETGPLRLLTVAVPPGEHIVALRYGTTPVRTMGAIVSALSLIVVVALAVPLRRRTGRATLALTALALLGVGALALRGPALVESTLAPADLGALRLLGGAIQERGPNAYAATLYWQAIGQPPDLAVGLRLVAEGETAAESVGRPMWGTASTAWWTANEIVRDVRTLWLRPGTAAGDVRVEAVVGDRRALVGTLRVAGRAPEPPLPEGLGRADGLRLLAGRQSPERVLTPGATIEVTFDWAADGLPSDDYALMASLIGPDGGVVTRSAIDPRDGIGLTSLWQLGERRTTRHTLRLPPDAPPGRYLVQASIAPFRTAGPPPRVVGLGLLPPLKLPEPPSDLRPEVALGLSFGEAIELDGYSFADEGDTLVLFWRARREVGRDYTVFVHLLDEAGRLIAQRDAPPQGGGYPTSLWSAGERVTDRIVLPEAEGVRTILIGLYDLATGARLPTPRGDALAIARAP
ncbi:MAG: hypothetical protein RMM58_00885 [Chloroflexota bacterium]|nr:hypothetical protein [Dehalococcoidia bacterium]MDW8252414.1 hypothetical protein [Chloroflexota bacterium]